MPRIDVKAAITTAPSAARLTYSKHGVSSATFYKWKATYGGMDVSQARKLKVLEDENARLKRLLADAMLDNAVLKEVASKNW